MPTLTFGVWLPTYAWPDAGPEHVQRLAESIRRCEEYGFDIWVIDHLLTAPGLYGVAWLEPLNVLAYAAALTQRVRLGTGILVLPVAGGSRTPDPGEHDVPYLAKTVLDRIVKAGLQYLVLGPVTDDPQQIDLVAQRITANFG
jgi:hypothetical protein